jgi:hypothetical protein
MSDRDMIYLQNLRKRLRQAVKEQADDRVLTHLIEEINITTDKLIAARGAK